MKTFFFTLSIEILLTIVVYFIVGLVLGLEMLKFVEHNDQQFLLRLNYRLKDIRNSVWEITDTKMFICLCVALHWIDLIDNHKGRFHLNMKAKIEQILGD